MISFRHILLSASPFASHDLPFISPNAFALYRHSLDFFSLIHDCLEYTIICCCTNVYWRNSPLSPKFNNAGSGVTNITPPTTLLVSNYQDPSSSLLVVARPSPTVPSTRQKGELLQCRTL